MSKKIFTSALIFLSLVNLSAQEKDETPVISPVVKHKPLVTKLDYNLTAGSSFMYAPGYGTGMSNYIAPEISYKLTPKIHLNAGVMFMHSNIGINKYHLLSSEKSVVIKNHPSNNVLAYVSGDYLLGDRVTLSGMFISDLTSPGVNRSTYNNSFQAMSLKLDYKITDNITIGAGMHMIQSNGLNYLSPGYGLGSSTQFNPLLDY